MTNKFILPLMADMNSQLDKHERDVIKKGGIKVEIGDKNFYKQEAVTILSDIACYFYNRGWKILENHTGVKFITSDTPIISLSNGDLYFPLTPDYALIIEFKSASRIYYNKIKKSEVKEHNKNLVKMAHNFVISSGENAGIYSLVNKYRNHQASMEFNSLKTMMVRRRFSLSMLLKKYYLAVIEHFVIIILSQIVSLISQNLG